MIPQHTIQTILETTRIEEVIEDFVSLKKAGSNYKALSPFTTEKTPSFFVSPAKQIFKCFSSGKGGNAVSFLMEHEKLTYPEALRYLAKKYNIEIEEEALTEEEDQQKTLRQNLAAVLDNAQNYFRHHLLETDEGKSVGLGYFRERGITDESIDKFQLGYAPEGWDLYTQEALKGGFSKENLLLAGLIKERGDKVFDFFRGRVMFPIQNVTGQVVAFAGRILQQDKKAPKYINSPETELYNKSKLLYGIFQAKKAIVKQDVCLLVEGYTDVISLHQRGVENVVASSGTSLTVDQIRLIKRYTPNVTILYDGDAAGLKASFRGIDLLIEQEMNVRVAVFPDGEDPDSYAQKHSRAEVEQFLETRSRDFVQFKSTVLFADHGDDPVKRTEALKDIASTIALIPDHIKRSVYIKSTSEQVQLAEEVLLMEVNRLRRQKLHRDSKRFKEPELQEAPPKPVVEERPLQTDHQEREVLRLLLLYGDQNFHLHTQDDEGREHTSEHNVLEFIRETVEADGIAFSSPVLQEVYNLVVSYGTVDVQILTAAAGEPATQLLTELVYQQYTVSENWDKKHDILTEHESDRLDRAVIQTLYAFLLKKVEQEIAGIQDAMKKEAEWDNILDLMTQQRRYEQAKTLFSKELQRVIIR